LKHVSTNIFRPAPIITGCVWFDENVAITVSYAGGNEHHVPIKVFGYLNWRDFVKQNHWPKAP
jgi:hypothetical protein